MKYAVLFIALLFAGCGSSTVGYEIEINGITLQIAKEDFPNSNWDNAISACAGLGKGWRLPNEGELKAMYGQLHKQGKGNFKNDFYWSSSEKDFSGRAWGVNFDDGSVYYDNKAYELGQVRAVRTLP